MNKIKENWQQVFMVLASLIMASIILLGGKLNPIDFALFALFLFAAVASIFKSKYVQFSYYLASLLWLLSALFLLSVGMIKFSSNLQHIPPIFLLSISVILLNSLLVPISAALFLGVCAKVLFDKPIQNEKVKKLLGYVAAIAIASVVVHIFLFSAYFQLSILSWIKNYKDNRTLVILILLFDGLLRVLIFQVISMILITIFIKNWSKLQALLTAVFASVVTLLMVDRNGYFLDSSITIGRVNLVQFFISIAMLYGTYFIVKRFVNNRFSVGFD